MESDNEDFVFYGTPIEREEDTSARKRKSIAGSGNLRSLPTWKQEVTDEEGRRRFHGAFTGGFSAGYYNTVGSEKGWSPQTFTSSRKSRAEINKQSIYNFLDEEDIKDMGGQTLETSLKFDTFGFTAAELARKQVEREQNNRPSAIPGSVPDEIVVPVSSSVGVKLLLKMGWRRGHSVKETQASSLHGARREARKALIAFSDYDRGIELLHTEFSKPDVGDSAVMDNDDHLSSRSTPAVLHPKQDLYGLGYDPFKCAPEFKERKMLREFSNNWGAKRGALMKGSHLTQNSGKYAPGFGIGALEELGIEDEDIYASGSGLLASVIEDDDQPSTNIIDDKFRLENAKNSLPGFKVALSSDYSIKRFHPPVIPPDYKPFHKFASLLVNTDKLLEPPPSEVPPPEDDKLRILIDGFANLVARCGKLFEDLSKEKNRSNPLFSFLNGGIGYDYYAKKLWEAKQKQTGITESVVLSDQKMTANIRGKVLGEKPLDRSLNESIKPTVTTTVVNFQSNLSDIFTQSSALASLSEYDKPFKEEPAKQERFELFLKEKFQGGLRSKSYGGTEKMSEVDRARERLDFEAAADLITKGKLNTKVGHHEQSIELSRTGDEHFIVSGGQAHRHSQDEVKLTDSILPKREEFQWRPAPLLCKRFDIADPFMGKPPPAPRPRSKMDALIFTPDSIMNAKNEEIGTADKKSSSSAAKKVSLPSGQLEDSQDNHKPIAREPDLDLGTSLQRPVDLYKAIFSDESDDEENLNFNSGLEVEKRTEGTNTTLNRIIAGDFLDSLGKELGLEVPEAANAVINDDNKLRKMPEAMGISDAANIQCKSNNRESGYNNAEKSKADKRKEVSRKHRPWSSDTDSSNDRGYHDRERKPTSKRKHARRYKHSSRYSDDESESELSDDGKRDSKSKHWRRSSKSGRHRK